MSCSNESTNITKADEKLATYQDVISKIYNSEAKNHILIENLGGLYSKNRMFSISSRSKGAEPLGITFGGREYSSQVNYSEFGNSWISNVDNSSLFGKKISISQKNGKLIFAQETNSTTAKGEQEGASGIHVYIPELVQVGVSGLVNGKLVPGTVITWNKDPKNENGMILGVEYNPYEQEDLVIRESKPNNEVVYDKVEDNGSYTVTKEDLEKFPKGAFLSFYIGRMAYTIDSSGSVVNETSVGALTAVRADYQINY
ncbi:hypothetical protein C1637_05855 [Chryseobacterium lactis]|uniref:Lipoprotein n=2 Tax=Chryseobacterium lactis TaxID=1241981 RepID=A0A3G6RLI5_CHRLC|nr:hypothetical protein EG342_21825 [Chryseobacterium lactis]AZB04753.1 hypothetical protein EG341_12705 [Chryseobacterium lactis]PNW14483.1 hypothetical protein C1637_05855 [Chryseobacterium lactis]